MSSCACDDSGSNTTSPDTTPPTITNHSFTVAENTNIGTVIGSIKASDNIAVIYYIITTGDSGYVFTINTNGELINVMNLDHDTTSSYSLTVQVSDAAGNTSNATITVIITDVDASPTVTTMGASGIENNSATLNGNLTNLGINSDGSMQVNEYGFIYSTNVSQSASLQLGKAGVEKIARTVRTTTGNYSFATAGLSPGTIHYFRAFAVNDGGTSYGGVSSFSTTYHQAFALSAASDEVQSNIIHANSTHTYSVFLSNTHSYNLTTEANSNVSDNVSIYQGTITQPLYIRAGSFSFTVGINANNNFAGSGLDSAITTTFSGVSNGSRHLVLPLSNSMHRLVLSNGSAETESYSLNLVEETGTAGQPVGRLLVDESPMGYFSNNEPILYWVHIPANLQLRMQIHGVLSGNLCGVRSQFADNSYIALGNPVPFNVLVHSSSNNRYHMIWIANNDSNYDYRGCQFRFRLQ